MKGRILSIQYMRGIAALLVVFFHYRFMLNNRYAQGDLGGIFSYGGMGVDLFFMISGFIIAFSTKNDTSINNFIIKRIFRIYPVYLTVLTVLFMIVPYITLDTELLKSILLINKDYTKPAPFFGYSTLITAWTLGFEMLFYGIFIVSMTISHKYRTLFASLIIITATIFLQFKFNGYYSLSGFVTAKYDNGFIKMLSSSMLLEFVFGMFIFEMTNSKLINFNSNLVKFISKFYFYFSFTFAITCYFSGYHKGHGLDGYGYFCAMLFSSFILHERANGIGFNKYLSNLGDWSYSIYLIHYAILLCIPYIEEFFQIFKFSYGASKFVFLTMLTILLSKLMYELIEKKCVHFSKRFLKH
ncbi:acyltransferase family protein [Hafnia sp.]|uniref:acyltransferase family protein n=1 Tax=Hafnia sp. TaxID=1873498 RepID=UPI002FC6C797